MIAKRNKTKQNQNQTEWIANKRESETRSSRVSADSTEEEESNSKEKQCEQQSLHQMVYMKTAYVRTHAPNLCTILLSIYWFVCKLLTEDQEKRWRTFRISKCLNYADEVI